MGISVDIQEDTFVKKSIPSYNLSAFVGADRFSFFVYDLPLQQVQLLRSYSNYQNDKPDIANTIHLVCTQDELLRAPFQRRSFALTNTAQTFVPDRLFKEDAKASYLDKMIQLEEDDLIKVDELTELNLKNVYPVKKGVNSLIEGYFPGAEVYHVSTWFIKGVYRLSQHRTGYQVYLNILGNQFQAVLFEGKDFLFSNQYSFQSANDFVYYTMLIFDQFKLKPESVPVYFAGEIMAESEVYKLLYRYIRHLHFVQLPDFLNFGPQIKAQPGHQSFNLYCAKLCV